MSASTRVLLMPELLENILEQIRDDLAIPQRVCRTWHDLIHNSASIGLYRAYQPSAHRHQKKSTIKSDFELESPIVYYNIQARIFPEDVWYLSPFIRVNFSPNECMEFVLRTQPFTSPRSILRNIHDEAATCPVVRSFRFSLAYVENVRPSWRDTQFSYPATTRLRFRMADIVGRPIPRELRVHGGSGMILAARIRDALQFQVVCETGITYGQIADAFARNNKRKHLENEYKSIVQWKLQLPRDSDDLTTFTYSMEQHPSTLPEKSSDARYYPKVTEGETVRDVVDQHKEDGWGFADMVNLMAIRRRRLNLRSNPANPSLTTLQATG